MGLRRLTILLFLSIFIISQSNSANAQLLILDEKMILKSLSKNDLDSSEQIIVAAAIKEADSRAEVFLLQRDAGIWKVVTEKPIQASIGRNGFAPYNQKREGDGRTPSGIYPIGTAFGYMPLKGLKMRYRQISERDFWVDDVDSEDYNKWVDKKPASGSYEVMMRKDRTYKLGFVVEYNTNPVIKGRGSAIFFHIWSGMMKPTSGCIAMSERDILRIMKWLDPSKQPLVILGTEDDIAGWKFDQPLR